jgi:hypothetical protein
MPTPVSSTRATSCAARAQKNLVVAGTATGSIIQSILPPTRSWLRTTSDATPGANPQPGDEAVQKFFRLKGGFLTMEVEAARRGIRLLIRHHAIDGAVVHEAGLDSSGNLRALRD